MNAATAPRIASPDATAIAVRTRALLPLLRDNAARSRSERRVAPENIAAMRAAGLFRICQPRRLGGFELGLPVIHATVATLAEHCPATAWVLMVLSAHTWMLGMFPEAVQDEIAAEDPDTLISGSLAATGAARRVEGGWRVTGRWPFASGCDHARWNLMGVKVEGGDGPARESQGQIHIMAPTRDYRIDDTWHVMGLEGTGSKDLVLEDVFVPAARALPTGILFSGRSEAAARQATGLFLNPVSTGLGYHVTAPVLGIARAVLAEIVERSRVRDDKYTGSRKADSAGLQTRIATADAEIKAAAALLAGIGADLDALATARRVAAVPERTDLRMRVAFATRLCHGAVERLFAAAGAGATYHRSPLQALFRDINVGTHHAMVDFDGAAEAHGRVMLGLPPGTPVL